MNTFKALLEREYWEHRGAFLKTPLIIGIVIVVFLILGYLTTERFDQVLTNGQSIELSGKALESFNADDVSNVIDVFMLATASLYQFVLFVVLFFFLLGSLYDDRKDGSILFWKSLPVSDTQTVLSKLVTATLVAPLLFTFGLIISHLAFFIVFSVIFLLNGANPFTVLWSNIEFINNWGAFVVGCLIQALWALPIYGWLLFASSYSKRRPFMLAVFVPLMVGLVWYWYNAIFNYNLLKIGVFKTLAFLLGKSTVPFTSGMDTNAENFGFDPTDHTGVELIQSMLRGLNQSDMYYGLVFATITIALAIYVRRFRNTT
ncbi:MAG: ABC-2 transporter permease [Marinicella sp.]|nr:ABC-2 transporter permease [Xanthomonadales bacterium]